MYQALYRKYRPRRFEDVVGQEHITQTLCRQIEGDRLSHAYLFVGTRGTGKTTCAKILSRAVNCENPVNGEPCNKCASCIGIESGAILDVLEIDAASNNGVDNVRELREDAVYSPATVKKRVYIIDEVHMLSTAAFNALLKILEEPPGHLMFILATTELHKVPATILSRCQRFSFKRLTTSVIKERLLTLAEREGVSLAADAAEKLSALADGSMRDAISLLDQCAADDIVDIARVRQTVGLVGVQETIDLARALADGDIPSVMEKFNTVYSEGRDLSSLLNELTTVMRDILLFKLSQESALLSGMIERSDLAILSPMFSPERLLTGLEIASETLFTLSRGGSAKLTLEICLIRLCDNLKSKPETKSEPEHKLVDELQPEYLTGTEFKNKIESKTKSKVKSDKTIVKMTEDSVVISDMLAANEVTDREEIAFEETDDGETGLSETADSETYYDETDNNETDNGETDYGETDEKRTKNEAGAGAVSEQSDAFWQEVLELLRKDAAVYSLYSDSSRITAKESGGIITINTDDAFLINQINSKTYSEPLKEAAGKVLGRAVTVYVESSSNNDTAGSRLDRLKELQRFEIVNFK